MRAADRCVMKVRYRSVFLSDLHLGYIGCRSSELLRLLGHLECENLYLVGDVVDIWRLRHRWYWPETHNEILRHLLGLPRLGVKVTFIPGNHDEGARSFLGMNVGGAEVKSHDVHVNPKGERLWITHGDQYDLVIKHSKVACWLGGLAYDTLVLINHGYNEIRRAFGHPYWSLSNFVKQRVKSAASYVERFEDICLNEAKRQGYDGVVCGHIHQASSQKGRGYYNCGDWVESCTLLAEHDNGEMELIDGLALLHEMETATQPQPPHLRAVS